MTDETHFMAMTADIVSTFVSNNRIAAADIPNLIASVHAALHATAAPVKEELKSVPAVPIKRSFNADTIYCLEDGKTFKSMTRHLRTDHDMTPAEYRTKWGLPSDYPMVAPNYSALRSEAARAMGLGARKKVTGATIPDAPGARGRGRPPGSKRA